MSNRVKLEVGTSVWWDGQAWRVAAFSAGDVELRNRENRGIRIQIGLLASSKDFKILGMGPSSDQDQAPAFLEMLSADELQRMEELERHLQEAITGFSLGSPALALENEPRTFYDPDVTTLSQRLEEKGRELGKGAATMWRLRERYAQLGLLGLADQRRIQPLQPFSTIDHRVKEALSVVLDEVTNESNILKTQILRRVRRRLLQQYPDEEIVIPSSKTFNKLVDRLGAGRGTFGAAKARRSIANRPAAAYRHFEVVRPGEVILIDSTPLDAYALDPVTFKWAQVQLTIAMDLYTGSIVAWRFTPRSTKGVDAALLLYDIIRPKLMRKGWPERARWNYVGIPEAVAIELVSEEEREAGLAGIPFLDADAIWVDHGRVFISRAFKDACLRLGIDLQLARPYTPTDKAHIERLFRTIRENFVVNLAGYKGPDVFSRGKDVEDEAFFFIDEIEAFFAEWVATYWQVRPHGGVEFPDLPKLDLSPNEMYEEGLIRAGFTYVIPDPALYFELLPTEWRKIHHYGIDLRGLRYNSEVLDEWRDLPSPYPNVHRGAWPIRYDPRDLSEVFFYDPTLQEWHAVPRHGASPVNRPFNDATLSYAKSLVISRGGTIAADRRQEMNQVLDDLLDRIAALEVEGRKERRLAAVHAMRTIEAYEERKRAAPQRQVGSVMEPDAEADLDDLFGPDEYAQLVASPVPEAEVQQGLEDHDATDREEGDDVSTPRKRLSVLDPDEFTV